MWNDENLIRILKDGGVAVMPTDTLYGIVGSAQHKDTVERIYNIRKRAPEKPCIILIGDINELEKFSVNISEEQKNKIKEFSDPVSIVLDCLEDRFEYLHRGTRTLAFRVPASQGLRDLLLKSGPLIAPSANTEALPPSKNIKEAKEYFGNGADLYIDGGEISGKASKVIRLHPDGTVNILRE